MFNAADIDNVKKVQAGHTVATLSQFAKTPPPLPALQRAALELLQEMSARLAAARTLLFTTTTTCRATSKPSSPTIRRGCGIGSICPTGV